MSLSCSCGSEDYESWYRSPDDFTKFNHTRRKRCVSCNGLIDVNTDCLEFQCYREPYSDIEERICGDEVSMANKYMCEKCGEIFLNLDALNYCIALGHNMKDDLDEYWELTGFQPAT